MPSGKWSVTVDCTEYEFWTEEGARRCFDSLEPGPPPARVPYRALRSPDGRTVAAAFPGGADLGAIAGLGLPVNPAFLADSGHLKATQPPAA